MHQEVVAFAKALKGRRDKMYLGYSFAEAEAREPGYRKVKSLQESFDKGLKDAGLDYVDLWRITCFEQSSQHDPETIEEVVKTLDWAKKSGRARFTGISSHDPPAHQIAHREVSQATRSHLHSLHGQDQGGRRRRRPLGRNEEERRGLVRNQAVRQQLDLQGHEQAGRSQRGGRQQDRLGWRSATSSATRQSPRRSPGLISEDQVDNVALAVAERRELDVEEKAMLDRAMDRAWANLPSHYQWLRNWEYV